MGRTAYDEWIDFSIVRKKTDTETLHTERVQVRITDSRNIVTDRRWSSYGGQVTLQWRKPQSRYWEQHRLRRWGHPRKPPWWFIYELSMRPNTKMSHESMHLSKAKEIMSLGSLTGPVMMRIEPSARVAELLKGKAEAAEKRDWIATETNRRNQARNEYTSSARRALEVAERCLANAETAEAAGQAGEMIFFAKKGLAERNEASAIRWPLDLDEPCPGDAGAIGELALLADEEEA